jgi:hypothetical protein
LLFDRGRIENVVSPVFKLEMATNTAFRRQEDCTEKTPRRQIGGESVSQSPLKDQAFSIFLDQNPPFELPPENGISPSTKACPVQWTVVDNSATKRLAKGKLPAHRSA